MPEVRFISSDCFIGCKLARLSRSPISQIVGGYYEFRSVLHIEVGFIHHGGYAPLQILVEAFSRTILFRVRGNKWLPQDYLSYIG